MDEAGNRPLAPARAAALRSLLLPGVLTNDSSVIRRGPRPPTPTAPPRGLLERIGSSTRRLQEAAKARSSRKLVIDAAPAPHAAPPLQPQSQHEGGDGRLSLPATSSASRRHLPSVSEDQERGGGAGGDDVEAGEGGRPNGVTASSAPGSLSHKQDDSPSGLAAAAVPLMLSATTTQVGARGGASAVEPDITAADAGTAAGACPAAPMLQRPDAADAVAPPAAAAPSKLPTAQWDMSGDPTEGALLTLAMKAGVGDLHAVTAAHPRLGVVPFDSDCEWGWGAVGVLTNVPSSRGHGVARLPLD